MLHFKQILINSFHVIGNVFSQNTCLGIDSSSFSDAFNNVAASH